MRSHPPHHAKTTVRHARDTRGGTREAYRRARPDAAPNRWTWHRPAYAAQRSLYTARMRQEIWPGSRQRRPALPSPNVSETRVPAMGRRCSVTRLEKPCAQKAHAQARTAESKRWMNHSRMSSRPRCQTVPHASALVALSLTGIWALALIDTAHDCTRPLAIVAYVPICCNRHQPSACNRTFALGFQQFADSVDDLL